MIGGDNLKDILNTYTDLTGKPPLVPEWSFGLWLSTSFTTDYDEKTVLEFVDGMAERDIPLNVFHFDCRWMKEFEWCNFEWDETNFPDPEGLIKKLHDRGIKVCVWINSYIAQNRRFLTKAQPRAISLRILTAAYGSGIGGRLAWPLSISPIRKRPSGISRSCAI